MYGNILPVELTLFSNYASPNVLSNICSTHDTDILCATTEQKHSMTTTIHFYFRQE